VGKKRVGKYPEAFRRMALERMKDCANVCALARELGIDRTVLYHCTGRLGSKGQIQPRHPRCESFANR